MTVLKFFQDFEYDCMMTLCDYMKKKQTFLGFRLRNCWDIDSRGSWCYICSLNIFLSKENHKHSVFSVSTKTMLSKYEK